MSAHAPDALLAQLHTTKNLAATAKCIVLPDRAFETLIYAVQIADEAARSDIELHCRIIGERDAVPVYQVAHDDKEIAVCIACASHYLRLRGIGVWALSNADDSGTYVHFPQGAQ
jgi:hypothetical protein